jgi:hypothetical protein
VFLSKAGAYQALDQKIKTYLQYSGRRPYF